SSFVSYRFGKERSMQMSSHGDQASRSRQQRKRLAYWFATLFITGALVLAALSFRPFSGTATARAGGWRLIWSDEFNGTAGTGVDRQAQRHRQRGFGVLASVLDARLGVPRQLPQLAQYRRDRHHGGRQRAELRVRNAPLWHGSGRAV